MTRAVERLLDAAGVPHRIERRRRHLAAVITVGGQERTHIFSPRPSDYRALYNVLAGIRRILRSEER